MNKKVQRIIALVPSFLILACSLESVISPATPATSVPPTAIVLVTLVVAQPSPSGSVETTLAVLQPMQELQPCSLVTKEEVEAILGEPATAPNVISGGCAFNNAKDSLYAVSVGAAQAGQADGILQGQAMLLGFAGAQLDQAKMAQLKSFSDAQDFKGFFTELVATAQGLTAIKAQLVEDGVSDVVYWAWLMSESRRQGAYVAVRGKTLVNVNVVVADSKSEQSMLEASQSLAGKIFDRLPAEFSLAMPTVVSTPMLLTGTPIEQTPAPTVTATWDPNAPPPGFVEQPPYTGDCTKRPAGSTCLGFDDGYTWFFSTWTDSVVVWSEAGTWQDKKIQVVNGQQADYYHILGTDLVKQVNK